MHDLTIVNYAKMAEAIEMPFGLRTRVGRSMRYMGHIGAIWQIRLNHPCASAMRPYVKLL